MFKSTLRYLIRNILVTVLKKKQQKLDYKERIVKMRRKIKKNIYIFRDQIEINTEKAQKRWQILVGCALG